MQTIDLTTKNGTVQVNGYDTHPLSMLSNLQVAHFNKLGHLGKGTNIRGRKEFLNSLGLGRFNLIADESDPTPAGIDKFILTFEPKQELVETEVQR